MLHSVEAIQEALLEENYVADRALATTVLLALKLNKPVLLEGEAGVGKTQVAKSLATVLARQLIRLQCYEGLDVNTTIYEWNYQRQLLQIRLAEARGGGSVAAEAELFSEANLIKRPLLRAIESSQTGEPPLLLIDELDRADEEFEAFLLELLSDFQITIPELGTIRATRPPLVIITSNRTREIHDALKRRCLYHWIDYPSAERELQVVRLRVPGAEERLSRQIVEFVQSLREMDLYKVPGVAETLDWANALVALNQHDLTTENITDTLGVLLKYQDDIEALAGSALASLVSRATGDSDF
jgi:MoxR-like ATPase